MNEQLSSFLADLSGERGLATNTLDAYRADLTAFIEFLAARGRETARSVTADDTIAYIASLRRAGRRQATVTRKLTSLRMFARYLCREEQCVIDFTAGVDPAKRTERRLPSTLTILEVNRLLAAPNRSSPEGMRDAVMFELMYAAGLRVSEMVSLRLSDLDLEAGLVRPFGKGSKERQTPIGDHACSLLRDYIRGARTQITRAATDAVFPTSRGGPMSREHFWLLIRRYAAESGITRPISPHTLRHTFATHLLAGGADIRAIQEMMGHAGVETTQRYTRVDVARLRVVYDKTHPRA
ncbi:MAG: tyrosine recombinase [Capsulimonadaceae bacterium]